MEKKIDYLDEDPPIPRQEWVCISYLSPEGLKNCKVRGVKVRGCYATEEEANNRAKAIQEFDPNFDVFVGQIGKWLAWNPDPSTAINQEYSNEKLNDLMKSYKQQLEKSKIMEHQRKTDFVEGSKRVSEDEKKEQIKNRLRKKLEDKKNEKAKFEENKEKTVEKIEEKTLQQNSEIVENPKIEEVISERSKTLQENIEIVDDSLTLEQREKNIKEKLNELKEKKVSTVEDKEVIDVKELDEKEKKVKEEIKKLKEERKTKFEERSQLEANLNKIEQLYKSMRKK